MIYVYEDEINDYLSRGYTTNQLHIIPGSNTEHTDELSETFEGYPDDNEIFNIIIDSYKENEGFEDGEPMSGDDIESLAKYVAKVRGWNEEKMREFIYYARVNQGDLDPGEYNNYSLNEQKVRKMVRSILSEIGEFNNNKTFTPPPNVAQRAQAAINVVSKNNLTQTLTSGSGMSKAKELATKQVQSFDMVRKIKSFFDTNEQAYKADLSAGKTVNNSGIIQSWELHGGDSSKDWANQEIGSLNSDNLNTKKNLRKAGGAGVNKGMGIFDKNVMSTNNHRIHR